MKQGLCSRRGARSSKHSTLLLMVAPADQSRMGCGSCRASTVTKSGHPLARRECFDKYNKRLTDHKSAERTQILSIKTAACWSAILHSARSAATKTVPAARAGSTSIATANTREHKAALI